MVSARGGAKAALGRGLISTSGLRPAGLLVREEEIWALASFGRPGSLFLSDFESGKWKWRSIRRRGKAAEN